MRQGGRRAPLHYVFSFSPFRISRLPDTTLKRGSDAGEVVTLIHSLGQSTTVLYITSFILRMSLIFYLSSCFLATLLTVLLCFSLRSIPCVSPLHFFSVYVSVWSTSVTLASGLRAWGISSHPPPLTSAEGLRPLVELCVEPAGLCGRCTGAMDMSLSKLWKMVKDLEA